MRDRDPRLYSRDKAEAVLLVADGETVRAPCAGRLSSLDEACRQALEGTVRRPPERFGVPRGRRPLAAPARTRRPTRPRHRVASG
jgi:hypothetical protein